MPCSCGCRNVRGWHPASPAHLTPLIASCVSEDPFGQSKSHDQAPDQSVGHTGHPPQDGSLCNFVSMVWRTVGWFTECSFSHRMVRSWIDVFGTQLYPTLCDPMNHSLPGSSVHGILQARILQWVAVLSPGDHPDLGIKPGSPTLQADSLPSEPPGKPLWMDKKMRMITFSSFSLKGSEHSVSVSSC